MISYIINGILLVGACILVISFFPIRSLIVQLPQGGLRNRWNVVRSLILFFITGYVIFIYLRWIDLEKGLDLIVPAVFFLGTVLILFIGTLALETAKEMKQIVTLQYENITDHLIGINNRRYLDRKIDEEVSKANRYGTPLSMLLIDIDNFKTVNDAYGHQVGDDVLKSLGQLIMKNARVADFVARYGGEEIAVLCPQTEVSSALDLAERLRQKIEKSITVPAEEYEDRQAIAITVSIGVSKLDPQFKDGHMLIRQADEALYKAKHDGRNRVVLFQQLMQTQNQVG